MRGKALGSKRYFTAATMACALLSTSLFACRPTHQNQAQGQTVQPAAASKPAASQWPAGEVGHPQVAALDEAAASSASAAADVAPGAAGEPHQQLPPPGLDGAAFLLQSGEPAAALARLAELEAPPAGADEWFRHKAIEGRAARLTGAHEVAVTALEALVAEKKLDHHLPSERVRFELALSLEALASSGALPVADADARRRDAVHQLALARKHTKIRNLPEVRVSEARVLAAIEGTNPSAARAAANRAI